MPPTTVFADDKVDRVIRRVVLERLVAVEKQN